jgi:chemotaxis protein histidine kinase CheA
MAEKVKFVIEVDDNGSAQVVDNLNQKVKESGDTAEKSQGKFGELGNKLAGIKGPVGQAVQGVQGLGTAFKALIANPIGAVIAAIVLALTALYKAFTSTKAGAEQMEQVMDALSAAVDVLRDRFLQLVGGIAKLFSGDIKGGLADLKGAFTGIGDEIEREATAAANLRKELQLVADAERELNKNRALQNRLIADAKLRINDENLSYQDRLKALEEVRKAEIKLSKDEEALAKRKYEAIVAQNALSDSSKEALDAEAAAFITLQNAQVASLAKQKELFDQEKSLRDRQKAEQKAAQAEAAQRQKERAEQAQKEFDDWLALEIKKAETAEANAKFVKDREEKAKADAEKDFQDWLKIETEKAEIAQANAKFVADREEKARQEKAKADKEASDAAIALKKAEFDAEMELLQSISGAFKNLANIAGEQTAAGKALAIASTIIDTYMGATKALAAGAGTPVGYINAAAIVATGLANLRTITAVQVPNGGGAGATASTPMMPSGPSVGIIQGQMSQTSQLQAELNSQMRQTYTSLCRGAECNNPAITRPPHFRKCNIVKIKR